MYMIFMFLSVSLILT